VRDALRNTSYALAGLALSLFGFGVVAPATLHVFTFSAGAGELMLAAAWWFYAGHRSAQVEQLTGIERVRDVVSARRLATLYTIVGLAASVDLLLIALLAPAAGSPTRHLHLLGLRVSISGPQLGTIGLVAFYPHSRHRAPARRYLTPADAPGLFAGPLFQDLRGAREEGVHT
jgi:hypothetical protein